MKYLKERGLDKLIIALTKPVLGICLGQQLMCKYSEEGNTHCLGIFDVKVKKFPPTDIVPHMGWNCHRQLKNSLLFKGVSKDDDVYFVHSYYAAPVESVDVAATTSYGIEFVSVVARDNVCAVQFHPEKSQHAGLSLLANFVDWDGDS